MENNFEGDPYLKISNLLLGAIINSRGLLKYEGKIFMVILFKTIGFQKEKDWLTWKQISKFTGIKDHSRIYEAIKKLKDNRLIVKEGKYFKVNQNFKEWLTLVKGNIELINEFYNSKNVRKSVHKENKNVRKRVHECTENRTSNIRKTVHRTTDKTITDKTYTDNNKIYEVFNYWNKKKIIVHKKLDSSTAKKINAKFKDYAREEILGAINNYSYILADSETYWFNYRWTLKEFLQRGFEKFKDWDIAHENYIRKEKLK